MEFDVSKSFSEENSEKELENDVIKRDDIVESDVKTEVADNELGKLKPKGALRPKMTAEKIESEEVSSEEEKITLLDMKRKRSRNTLNDENPDERSVKIFKTKQKIQEKNSDQWMQRSTARTLRKLKPVNTALDDVISEVENKKAGGIKRVYNRKAKEDGSKLKEVTVEKPKKGNLSSASTKETSRVKSGESKSTAKQKIREQIKSLLLNAGWKIDLRPRNGRDYYDSVYIPPSGGGGFWSITKAYNVYLKQNKTEETASACVMVPPDQVNMLTRVVVNKRGSGKNKTSEKNNQGLKIRKVRNDVSKPRKKEGIDMSMNDAKQDEDDDDGYEPYSWKRSILSWMTDMGVIKVDGEVKYMNKEKSQALLEGFITRDGILCGCCNETVCVSTFEIHAGSKLNQPYENTVLEKKGVSLLDCQVNAWEKQKVSEKQDFYEVDISGDDNSDDTCGICGDGGDLVCCDGCPSTFHLNCLDMEMLPPDDWHCTNCSCRYCNSFSAVDLKEDDPVISRLLTCFQCEKKYHPKCIPCEESTKITSNDSDASFCGKSCKKLNKEGKVVATILRVRPRCCRMLLH